jgi:hypothetical protein
MAPTVPLAEVSQRIDAIEARVRAAVPVARVIYLEPAVLDPSLRDAAVSA